MQQAKIGVLMMLVFATAMMQIYIRHQHRIEFMTFNAEIAERDDLSIEWNQLLTESSTYSSPHRVESEATKRLSMRVPKAKDIVSIDDVSDQAPQSQEDLDSLPISNLMNLKTVEGLQ